MHSLRQRQTASHIHTAVVLGILWFVLFTLAVLSGPGGNQVDQQRVNYEPATTRLEGVIQLLDSSPTDPDLDVNFSDWEFGSHIPTDNGAAEYMRKRREIRTLVENWDDVFFSSPVPSNGGRK